MRQNFFAQSQICTEAIISRSYLPFVHGAIDELERLFHPFNYKNVCNFYA